MQPGDSSTSLSGEHPLNPGERGTLVVSAAATIFIFYAVVIASLALLALFVGVLFVAMLFATRFGLGTAVGKTMALPMQLFLIFARNLWLPTSPVYQLRLERSDAPRLFGMIDDLARRTGVPAPNHISVEMTGGAWVMLRGFSRGSGTTSLSDTP